MSESDSARALATDGAGARKLDPSPIALSRIACPVCRTVNEFEAVRPGAYVEEGTDTDFRPLRRRWSNPRYQSVNPLLYFMATCTTCFYTREFNRAIRDARHEGGAVVEGQKELRLKHLGMLADSDGVARRLGYSLWPESFPLETAISKFLLGVLDEALTERPSNYDLARWYLRIAWLFRESQPHGRPNLTSPSAQSRRDLGRAMEEIDCDMQRLRVRVTGMIGFFQAHPGAAQKHPEDYQGPLECRQGLQLALEQMEGFIHTLSETRKSLHPSAEQFVGGERQTEKESFGEHASYTEFLRALRLDSPLIPLNEEEALSRSLSHYKQAFEANGGIESGNGAMLTAYLIGELSRRLANFDDAERFLDMARMAAQATIAENPADRPRTALARHLAVMAERQSQSLYDRNANR